MKKLISIIIPVYKVEEYIEKCIQSLLDQTYTNFEALIVDDGSPDSSIALAKALVAGDPRFVFFTKENGGQGTARNLALDHIKGDYVTFLDSDDFYTSDMLSVVIKELSEDSNIDVLAFGMNQVDEDGKLIRRVFKDPSELSTDKDVLLLNQTLTNYFCDKIFKKEIISGFRFSTVIKTYEDVDLLYQVLYGRKIKNIFNCLYNYTQREGSTSYSLAPSYISDKRNIVINAKEFLFKNHIYNENENYYFCFYLIEMFYKPLIKIAMYSTDYNRDINKLLAAADREMLSFKNIYALKSYGSIKEVLSLSVFKVNRYFFRAFAQLWFFIKEVKK